MYFKHYNPNLIALVAMETQSWMHLNWYWTTVACGDKDEDTAAAEETEETTEETEEETEETTEEEEAAE